MDWRDIAKAAAQRLLQEAIKGSSETKGTKPPDHQPPRPQTAETPKAPEPETPTAPDIQILVAPRDSDAYRVAEEIDRDEEHLYVDRKLHRALQRGSDYLNANGPCTVTIRLAAGDDVGKGRTGVWVIPSIKAPDSCLRILGGHSADWTERHPFTQPSRLVVSENRTAAVLQVASRRDTLGELYVSGLTIDAGPSNRYDQDGNLLGGGSATNPILWLSYLRTKRLVIADNVFVNAAHRVAEPLIYAATEDAEVIVRNNVILSNVFAWRVFSAGAKYMPKRYRVEGNTFVLNWPRNPDAATSNPGALEIGGKTTAHRVEIHRNLFAFNAGGAIHIGQDEQYGPPIAITENLFWGNGDMFDIESPGGAAVVGKFNRSAVHGTFEMVDIEDDFDWEVRDNVAMDPGLRVQVKPLQTVDLQEGTPNAQTEPGTAQASEGAAASELADFSEMIGEADDPGSDADDLADDADGSDSDFDAFSDFDSSDAFGSDDAFSTLRISEDGLPIYSIANFALRVFVEKEGLPLPENEEAKAYGASPERVKRF